MNFSGLGVSAKVVLNYFSEKIQILRMRGELENQNNSNGHVPARFQRAPGKTDSCGSDAVPPRDARAVPAREPC